MSKQRQDPLGKRANDSRDIFEKALDNPYTTGGALGGAALGVLLGSRGGRKIMKAAETRGTRAVGRDIAIAAAIPSSVIGASFGGTIGAAADQRRKPRRKK